MANTFTVVRQAVNLLTKAVLFLVCIALSSCSNGKTAPFEIVNNTPQVIDSLYLEPSFDEVRTYLTINPGQRVRYDLDMDGISTDGAYGLFYKINGSKKVKIFGYYSNGLAMEQLTKIEIRQDTILFKFLYK